MAGTTRRRRAAAGVLLACLVVVAGVALPRVRSEAPPDVYLTVDRSALLALPTSGAEWAAVVDGAAARPDVDLADHDSTDAASTLAAALVHARTGSEQHRSRAVASLRAVPTSSLATARVLSVGRQLAGYAIAADLVGYRDPAFVEFMRTIRTRTIGNHGRWVALTQTSADSASNWGAWALASRIAASRYLGDTADLADAARIFRGWLGDRSAHAFNPSATFKASYVCGPVTDWVPVNPVGCGDLDGALVDDINRSAGEWPTVDSTGIAYSWESLGGATLSAQLLARGGYPDVYSWSDRALLRAAQFLQRHGGYAPPYSVNQYIPWAVNKAYGTTLGPLNSAGAGRQYGFTDWLP